jgi:hypothetical protein
MKLQLPRSWLALSALAYVVSSAERALADDLDSASGLPTASAVTRARSVVLLQPNRDALGTEPPSLDFFANLRWQLAEMHLTLVDAKIPNPTRRDGWLDQAERIARADAPWLIVWVTYESNRANVFLYDPSGPHLYVQVVSTSDSPLAASEEIALILRSAIQARTDGGASGMSEVALPERAMPKPGTSSARPPRVVSQPPPAHPMNHWGLAMSGALEHPVSPGPWQGGVAMRAWGRIRSFRLGLASALYPGLTVASESVEFRLHRYSFEAFAGIPFGSERTVVVLESGLGTDLTRRVTASAAPPLRGLEPDSRWLFTVSQRLRIEQFLGRHLWLTAAAGLVIPLNPYRFEVVVADQTRSLTRILPVRPSLDFGILVAW